MTESIEYPSGAIEHLRAADPVLSDLITRYGIVTRDRGRPAFYALIAAIVGQQISVKAAAAISWTAEMFLLFLVPCMARYTTC